MARGTGLGALFLWLAVVGCGSSPPAETVPLAESGPMVPSADESVGNTPVNSIHTPVDAGTPPWDGGEPPAGDGGTADAGAVPAPEASPSLPEPTCIPSPYAAPPVEAQACAVSTVWADGRRQAARYDPDGRLLELRTNNSAGAPISVETHVWQNGVELQRRVSGPGGGFEQTNWIYDGQWRLVLRVDQGSAYRLTEYEYYDDLLNSSATRDSQGDIVGRSEYSHDAQGRLTGIGSHPCDLDLNRCEDRSYWPNGQLRHHHWSVGYQLTFSEEYNELGWLVGSTWGTGSAGSASKTTRIYDSAGRPSRIQTRTVWEFREADALTTRLYTTSGWRERFAEDTTHYPTVTNPDRPVTYTHRRTTQRASFLCGTSVVALQEWDPDEDGIVDAHRIYTRDSRGRLVREHYSGTPNLDAGPLSRDFFYDCF